MKKSINDFEYVLNILKSAYEKSEAPSVTLIAETKKSAYHVLVSTLISLRTKDEVTLESSKRLFVRASSMKEMLLLDEEEIGQLIYPAGFYKTKAKRFKEIAFIIEDKNNGRIPDTMEDLLALPGVGRKTANLVLSLGFNKPGLCVDTHVHRITNRFGWISTKTPEKTEFALREILPEKYWRAINDYLVSYGQTICRPISPWCSRCQLKDICPQVEVKTNR